MRKEGRWATRNWDRRERKNQAYQLGSKAGRYEIEKVSKLTHAVWGFPFSGKEESVFKLCPLCMDEVSASISAPWLMPFPGAATGPGTMVS